MAFEQYFVQEWQPKSENSSACFDCCICLDFARDPVVTLCGHLYCWPCIYKWFDSQTGSDQLQQCPVCKAEISQKTVVPLYGRGQALSESEPQGKIIPPRPPACGTKGLADMLIPGQQFVRGDLNQNPRNVLDSELLNRRGAAAPGLAHPTAGMLGEMVYARVFGNSESLYIYPTSYHYAGSSSPRLRRRELEAHKSLKRVSVFFFCCIILCLLVF